MENTAIDYVFMLLLFIGGVIIFYFFLKIREEIIEKSVKYFKVWRRK